MKKNKLLQYSSMAVTFIASGAELGAQAVYVDIDPDTVLSVIPFEVYSIQLDNDPILEYNFTKGAGSGYADWCECFEYITAINLNGTESKVVFTSYQFTSDQYLVSAMEPGVLIGESLNFKDNDTKMAYRIIPDWSIYYVFDGGDWFPEAIDKYVGIRFEDSLDCMHYGWIRCSVEDGGSKLTIKDYAFETKCDVAIVAGDTIGDTTGVGVDNLIETDAIIYSFGKSIYIRNKNFTNSLVTIFNSLGQLVLVEELKEEYSEIDMKLNLSGIYLVRLTSGDRFFIKKVVIK